MKTTPLKTLLILIFASLIFYSLSQLKWLLIVAMALAVIGFTSNYLTRKIDYWWMKLSQVLGYIVPNILLTLIFYLFLFPIALIARLVTKKDRLSLKNNKDSLFVSVNKKFDAASFEHPW